MATDKHRHEWTTHGLRHDIGVGFGEHVDLHCKCGQHRCVLVMDDGIIAESMEAVEQRRSLPPRARNPMLITGGRS